jgi:hypothetical protein
MAMGSTQLLTEMSTRNVSWGKGGRCVGLTTLPPSCANCLEIWEPQPPGTLSRPVMGLLYLMTGKLVAGFNPKSPRVGFVMVELPPGQVPFPPPPPTLSIIQSALHLTASLNKVLKPSSVGHKTASCVSQSVLL